MLGRLLYGFVARNRYSLSKCRGGACRVAKPEAVRRQARLGAFWSCYTLGFFIRLPLVLWAGIKAAATKNEHLRPDVPQAARFAERQADHSVSERHVAQHRPAVVRGTVHDRCSTMGSQSIPARPRCDDRLPDTFAQSKPKITKVVATHAHEEHVGNLNWLSELTGAPDLRFGDDRPVPDAIQEASVGTRHDHRAASELEAAVPIC